MGKHHEVATIRVTKEITIGEREVRNEAQLHTSFPSEYFTCLRINYIIILLI